MYVLSVKMPYYFTAHIGIIKTKKSLSSFYERIKVNQIE